MSKVSVLFISLLIASVILVVGLKMLNKDSPKENTPVVTQSANETPKVIDLTAVFEIYTNGTKRIFSQSMYLNRSSDIFIQNPDPSVIHVKKQGITWNDFFKTLPFSLTKDCIITGTNQEFCSNETKKLTFILNGEDTPNALDLEIKQGDKLVVTYGN